jgi:hypothetical protein
MAIFTLMTKEDDMGPPELNLQELQDINGGSNASANTLSISTGTDALLSLNYEWSQGDKGYEWSLEVGKDVNADIDLFSNREG